MIFFKGIRNTISNIAQIVLVVLLLPFVAILFGVISGTDAGAASTVGLINSLIGKIPLCEIWLDVLYQYSGGLSAEDILSSSVLVILKALPEALISAACVYLCIQISKKLMARGLPIFATFVGIVIASVITGLTGLSNNMTTEIIADFGVSIIILIGLKIMAKSLFKGLKVLSGKKILLFVIDGLFAVITTAYISGLIMAAAGIYSSVGQAIGRVVILTGIEIAVAIGVGIIGDLAEKDSSIV